MNPKPPKLHICDPTQALDEANKCSQARVVELESWAREEDKSVYHDLSLCVIPMPVFLKQLNIFKKKVSSRRNSSLSEVTGCYFTFVITQCLLSYPSLSNLKLKSFFFNFVVMLNFLKAIGSCPRLFSSCLASLVQNDRSHR